MNKIDINKVIAAHEAGKAARAIAMPDDSAALGAMGEVYTRLREMGWNDAIYCPKDGSVFEVIEFGSTGIHKCNYDGEWPKGTWWTHCSGDLWPSRPVLFRLIDKPTPSPTATGMGQRNSEGG